MRNRSLINLIFVSILFLTIGFATIATNFVMNGTLSFGVNTDDFDVIFTKSIIDDVDVSSVTISEDGKTLNFETKDLSKIGDYTKLEFEVTNNSTQYDASINLNCEGNGENSKYYSISESMPSIIYAKSKDTGVIKVTLNNSSINEIHESFTCTIEASAIERVTIIEDNEISSLSYSVYSWHDIPLLSENFDNTLEVLKKLDVKDLYHSIGVENLSEEQTKTYISNLNNAGIDTYFLTGHPSWYNNFDSVKSKIDEVYSYNSSVDDLEQIKGLTLDIEAYLNDEYKSDIPTGFVEFANTIEEIYAYSKSKGLDIVIVLPYWFDTSYFSNTSSYSDEEKANMENAYRKIFMNVDRVSIMNYYKTNMVNAISYEMNLAKELGVEIESIGEFNRPSGTDIPETISLWVEDNPIEYANKKWDEIQSTYNYDSTSYSYHDLEAILEIYKLYKNTTFEIVDSEGKSIDVEEILISFESGEKEYVYTSNNVALPIEKKYQYYIYGYNIINENIEDLGDNLTKTNLVVEQLENYILETYPKLYNGTTYVSLNSGKITLKNDLFEIERSRDITTDGYAVISNLYANVEYQVTVEDLDGNSYTFEYATSRDDNSQVNTISDENGNIIIPSGLKSNLYAASTFYLK